MWNRVQLYFAPFGSQQLKTKNTRCFQKSSSCTRGEENKQRRCSFLRCSYLPQTNMHQSTLKIRRTKGVDSQIIFHQPVMQISFFPIVIAYQHSESLFDFELVQNTLERSSPNILSAFSNPTQSLHALFINLNNPMK